MAESAGLVPRMMWRIAPRLSLGMTRRRFAAPIVGRSPERDDEHALHAEVEALAEDRRFDEILDILRAQMSSRATTLMGVRHSEVTLPALYSGIYRNEDDPSAADAAAAPFREWFAARGKDADVAAVVARAIQILAHIHRGQGWADETSDAQWQALATFMAEAREMLDSVRAKGMERELWHRARFRGALNECEDAEDVTERFERFLSFDRGNIETYLERTHQLLPRWFGGYEEIEAFARQSVERTRKMWGRSIYMMIHWQVSETEPLTETAADWQMLLQSFDEALDRFPPIPVINRFIALAARLGRDGIVRDLFAELPELRLDYWEDPDEPFEVLAWAHGRAPWPYERVGS